MTTKDKDAKPPIARRDATGHLDPQYAADLRARSKESAEDNTADRAFLKGAAGRDDALASELGAEAVATMTSAEDQSEQLQDAEVGEERGGPFVITTSGEEVADGVDASNPKGATREPIPKT